MKLENNSYSHLTENESFFFKLASVTASATMIQIEHGSIHLEYSVQNTERNKAVTLFSLSLPD